MVALNQAHPDFDPARVNVCFSCPFASTTDELLPAPPGVAKSWPVLSCPIFATELERGDYYAAVVYMGIGSWTLP